MPDKQNVSAPNAAENSIFPATDIASVAGMLRSRVKPRTQEEIDQAMAADIKRRSFTEMLLSMPEVVEDSDFDRNKGPARKSWFGTDQ